MAAKFSERIGKSQPKTLQTDSMDADLRHSLWNCLLQALPADAYWTHFARASATGFFKLPTDELPLSGSECQSWVKRHFYRITWFQAYDFIEFFLDAYLQVATKYRFRNLHSVADLEHLLNAVLQRELSAYRLIDGVLSPISSPAEIAALQGALHQTLASGLSGAYQHLHIALQLLGKKPEPDYRNTVKESISSVESVCKQLSRVSSGGLDDALTTLGQKIRIHPAMRAGFLSLYGYTSDAGGIRHALLDQPTIDFDEAKFMLVSCSAFVYYLIGKAANAGLLKA